MFTRSSRRARRVGLFVGAVTAAVGIVAGVAIAATPFVDINGHPNAADIDATYNAGVATGCDATHFCPNDPLKRGDAAAFLARAAGLSSTAAKRFPIANARSDNQTFCSLYATSPRSFEGGPCMGTTIDVDPNAQMGQEVSVAIGADGMPIMSYFDAKNGDLRVARCANPACSGGTTYSTIDATGVVGRYSSMVIGTDGFPLISYYDVTNGDLKVAHCTNVGCTGNATTSVIDAAGDVGQFSALAIGADGIGVIAYYDATNGDLKTARCTATACTNSTKAVFDGAGQVGQFVAVAVGADNIPAITYFDVTNNRLKFTRCSDATCKAATSTSTLDPNSVAGKYTSIAIGVDNLPVIAYYDMGATDLKVLHCGNATCGAGNSVVAVDFQGDVGKYASIAIGTDGRPVVASYRTDGGNLRLARCLNVTCSASVLRNLESNGDVGSFASLALGADGVPIVAYQDLGRTVLRAARPPAA